MDLLGLRLIGERVLNNRIVRKVDNLSIDEIGAP